MTFFSGIFGASSPGQVKASQAGTRVEAFPRLSSRQAPPAPANATEYTHIILGAGTSGSVLASRLSENPDNKILVLNHGPRVDDVLSRLPLFSIVRSYDPKYAFIRYTTPQSGLGGRSVRMLSGKVVGGSSAINASIYTLGPHAELNAWAEKLQAPSWSASALESVLRLPKHRIGWSRTETATAPPARDPNGAKAAKGLQSSSTEPVGPWETYHPRQHKFEQTALILQELDSMGIKTVVDSHSPASSSKGPIGTASFTLQASHASDGTKCHAGNAFLTNAVLSRPNLTLCTNVNVLRLQLGKGSSGNRSAKGVWFEELRSAKANADSNAAYYAASNSVIVCQGVYDTPMLLHHSGIGPPNLLKSLDIPVRLSLPQVGANLQDHVAVPLHFLVPREKSGLKTVEGASALVYGIRNAWDYFRHGKGLFTSTGFMESAAWFNTQDVGHDESGDIIVKCSDPYRVADIELMFSTYYIDDSFPRYAGLEDGLGVIGVLVVLAQPKAAGSVRPASADPRDVPLIDPAYLSDPDDLKRLALATKVALQVVRRLKQTGFEVSPASIPGRDGMTGRWCFDGPTDFNAFPHPEEIPQSVYESWIRANARPIYHGTSTMALRSPNDTPIDAQQFTLKGVDGLRVCDASIFPNVPSTHPQSWIFALAERLARRMSE
ncbi:Glucose dehydrogenase/choline dehydrogenase/mandelonitrile lyase (GMC oxidoreductase family) [Ceraceosorus bombacis]|uniref:Glucose dehydrogenase/choline dehydrogenase/mandelonitrile lyase (GMC oxidoreductase family) n=1 Tax=Ceraceosorus bombacis TaxID=401625 RepID=A0A0P1BKN8_9BASI|nr:Glucose dehydrogenase/choline dehydrogenase/mandelonitrile lyase (GMC oxidoreductase family) [Ceraceosorus bombacis]